MTQNSQTHMQRSKERGGGLGFRVGERFRVLQLRLLRTYGLGIILQSPHV